MKTFFYIFILVVFTSCSAKHSENLFSLEIDKTIQGKLASSENLYFQFVFDTVLKSNCIECHSATESKGNVDLSTYAAALGQGETKKTFTPFLAEESSLYQTLILKSGSRMMPPADSPPISDIQKKLIYEWIQKGALIKGQITPPKKTVKEQLAPYFKNPLVIDYKLINKTIFKNQCLDCHSFNGSKPDFEGAILYGQDMTDYSALFLNNGIVKEKLTDYVISKDGKLKKKKGSRIYKSVAVDQTMPPENHGYKILNPYYTKLIRLWILNCAIEDYNTVKDNDNILDDENSKKTKEKLRDCSF